MTQALSGHGCFQHYLHRIGKAPSPKCMSDTAEQLSTPCSVALHPLRASFEDLPSCRPTGEVSCTKGGKKRSGSSIRWWWRCWHSMSGRKGCGKPPRPMDGEDSERASRVAGSGRPKKRSLGRDIYKTVGLSRSTKRLSERDLKSGGLISRLEKTMLRSRCIYLFYHCLFVRG
jgi:hypothetical protein